MDEFLPGFELDGRGVKLEIIAPRGEGPRKLSLESGEFDVGDGRIIRVNDCFKVASWMQSRAEQFPLTAPGRQST